MLFWLDLETTGLDTDECAIAELGLVVTTDGLEVVAVFQTPLSVAKCEGKQEEYAMAMHAKSGLLKLCEGAPSPFDVQSAACNFVASWCHGDRKPLLAGSTVHFDRAFLRNWMPDLERRFHHRHLDVSALKEAMFRFRPDVYGSRPKDRNLHRVLPDIEDSIAELRHYRAAMGHVTEPESELAYEFRCLGLNPDILKVLSKAEVLAVLSQAKEGKPIPPAVCSARPGVEL